MEISDVREIFEAVTDNVGKVMVGKEGVTTLALVAILSDGHVLLEDVPGLGKTTLAKALAISLGCGFKRIQFTPDLLPSDITGVNVFNQKGGEFEFVPGPVMTQMLLADEINRATPRTQSALLEAMQERQVTIDRETHPLPKPFFVLATQNPIELEGTFTLPEAQVDRFLMKLAIGYPGEEEEREILERFKMEDPLQNLKPVISSERILEAQEAVKQVAVAEPLKEYVVSIARATREHPSISLGVSPRGTMALFRASQAVAAIRGRDFVIPDDVKELVPYVLTHRIHLSTQVRLRGRTPEDILEEIIKSVPAPVVD